MHLTSPPHLFLSSFLSSSFLYLSLCPPFPLSRMPLAAYTVSLHACTPLYLFGERGGRKKGASFFSHCMGRRRRFLGCFTSLLHTLLRMPPLSLIFPHACTLLCLSCLFGREKKAVGLGGGGGGTEEGLLFLHTHILTTNIMRQGDMGCARSFLAALCSCTPICMPPLCTPSCLVLLHFPLQHAALLSLSALTPLPCPASACLHTCLPHKLCSLFSLHTLLPHTLCALHSLHALHLHTLYCHPLPSGMGELPACALPSSLCPACLSFTAFILL